MVFTARDVRSTVEHACECVGGGLALDARITMPAGLGVCMCVWYFVFFYKDIHSYTQSNFKSNLK